MSLPKKVKLVEVGPRDGLQNEAKQVPPEVKIEFINRLGRAGLPVIESGSFVSAKWVPQMADSDAVFQAIEKLEGVGYPVLVPNLQGLESAIAAGVSEIAVFAAASESFSQKNINCSISESLDRYTGVMRRAIDSGLSVRGYVSCVMGCPYEGEVAAEMVAEVAERLFQMGCYEISLGDTVGVGTPLKAQAMIQKVSQAVPLQRLAAHFHDTYGQALVNLYTVLQLGVATIDASAAGLGGCPYARGASGNVATEDVLYLLDGLGIETGVDLNKLAQAGGYISDYLQRDNASRVARALLATDA